MSTTQKATWSLMVIILVGLAACGGAAPTTDPNLVHTQIWQTVQAAQTLTGLAVSPTPSATDTPEISVTPRLTNTPLITDTLLPGAATASPFVISTATVAVTKSSTCDNAQFVSETYTDGSVVSPGAVFIKTWTYKNLGPCTWNQDYKLIYGYAGDGTNWNTTPATYFPSLVVPGDKVDLSVTLTAPSTPGNYIAFFRLQNDNGFNFGDPPYLSITVK